MSPIAKFKPKPQAYELDVYLAPGHWFFCRRIDIPEDLEKGEEEGFALLELENLSPFPLEHLHFGYRLDEARRHAFIFAAYKRRFEGVDTSRWRRLDAALPDFMQGLQKSARDARSPLVLVTGRSMVGFRYDDASELPVAFYAEDRPKDEEGDWVDAKVAVAGFCERAKSRLGEATPRIWIADTKIERIGQATWLAARDISGASAIDFSFSRDEMWRADIRDPEMLQLAKQDERQNGILWKCVAALLVMTGLLLAGELYWGGKKTYQSWVASTNRDREASVFEIQGLEATANSLRDFNESNLAPFKMIEALIPYQNPPNVVYRKFETKGPFELDIDAWAANRAQVTEFKKRLDRFSKVEAVELSKQVDNPKGSTFTATIRFVPGAFTGIGEVSQK